VRYFDIAMNEYRVAEPGDIWFSTVTMLATEYWDGESWKKIYDDAD